MSSRIIKSAREPVSWPVIPTDLTEGAWWGEQETSKLIRDQRESSPLGCKCFNHGVSIINFCKKNLSSIKCPKTIDFEKELPRHPTGKLYKRLLKDRYWGNKDSKIV